MRERFCEIELADSTTGAKYTFRDLAISFSITALATTKYAEGIITIAGLSTETINTFTMFLPNWLAEKYEKRVKLTVGYVEENGSVVSSTIFNGFIRKALPTMLPERVFVMEVMEVLNASFDSKILKYDNTNLKKLVSDVAKSFNFSGEVEDLSGKAETVKIDKYIQNGNLQQHLEKIKNMFYTAKGYRVWLRNGVFYIGNFSGKVEGALANNVVQIGEMQGGLKIYDMVAPDVRGITVATEIVDTLQIYSKVRVESKQIPAANGQYTVLSMRWVGETRGTQWKCILECINPDRDMGV